MASSENLQQTMLWCGAYVRFQPLAIGGGEPAVSNANLIKQTMLGAPFKWPWNRATGTADCSTGVQDSVIALPYFGFIEKAWISIDGASPFELTVRDALAQDAGNGRPQYIAVQNDDGQGSITFRLSPPPDKDYQMYVLYQQKATLMTSLASRWSPIPDELGYIFKYGFLAMSLMITGDVRFPIFNDRFVAHLLGAQDGLDDLQRNIFLANWLEATKTAQRSGTMAQQGIASRAK